MWTWTSDCHRCRERLPAFIHRDLSPRARRRIAAHLDCCPACETEYRRQRELSHLLASEIPALGRRNAGGLERVWLGIRTGKTVQRRRFHKRYGAAALLTLAALILPSVLSAAPRATSVPTPATPAANSAPIVSGTPQFAGVSAWGIADVLLDLPPGVTLPAQPRYAPDTLVSVRLEVTDTPHGY
jgi:anti-sigma factor RsiW